MNPKKFSDAMSEIDNKYVDEAIRYEKSGNKHGWVRWAASAACFAFIAAAVVSVNRARSQAGRGEDQIELSDSSINVTVRYVNGMSDSPFSQSRSLMVFLTEEELFTRFDTAIFKGTISELRNIELDFNGTRDYRAIAKIEVEKVYRGPCGAGDTVTVLLPCRIAEGLWVEDTGTVSSMEVGMTGIFMPTVYDDTSIREQSGARLALKDVADYGFADGERYAFLETRNGLVFSRWAYESISDAATLDEIEDYILDMIGK